MHGEPEKTVKSDVRSGQVAQTVGIQPLGTTLLTPGFNLKSFTSRSARIQQFIQQDALEYIKKRYANVFVWPHPDDAARILGFYSLSPCSIERAELSNHYQRRGRSIPGIPVPMALLGYMGKAPDAPKGFGAALVLDAARRIARPQDLPVWGIALHPENLKLAEWYETLGFVRGSVWTKDNQQRLVMYAPTEALLSQC